MLLYTRSFLSTKEKITSFFKKKPPESQFEQWDAAAYIVMVRDPNYRSRAALTNLLTANFVSFAAEYTRGEVISTFEMDVSPSTGLLGMLASYTQGLLGMGENFESKLETKGKSITRAQLETNNMYKLDQWAVAAPIGSLFIWNSPPGKVSEGYAGLNSHSFIFAYEKTSADKVVLHQYRTWMNLEQHQTFQTALDTQNAELKTTSVQDSHQIINNTAVLSPKDIGCENAQQLVSLLEKNAYESSDTWRTKPSEMPQIDEAEYATFRDFLLSLYIRTVVPLLLAEVPEVESTEDPQWQTFIASKKYTDLISQLDIAFGILAYQPLVKWVEAADETPQKSKNILQKLFSKSNKETNKITEMSQSQIEEGLMTMYQLRVAKLKGEKMDAQKVSTYNTLAQVLLSTTSRGLSLGQCGIGTFIPTKMLQTGMPRAQLGAPQLLNPGLAAGLPAKEKLELSNHLNTLSFLPLVLPNGETWYIKAQHYTEYKTFFTQNEVEYSPQGFPIGPCGWALRGDSRGEDELVLTVSEYNQLQALQALLLQDLLDNPEESFDVFASKLLDSAQSESEKVEIAEVIALLKEALKTTLDIGDLLFSEFFDALKLFAHPVLSEVAQKVSLSNFIFNPEETASQVVVIYQQSTQKMHVNPDRRSALQ